MKIQVSHKLIEAYKTNRKNPNYALDFILSSLDPGTCIDGLSLVDSFNIGGNNEELEIDEKNIKAIKSVWKNADEEIINKLLWIAFLFPEI